MSASPSSRAFAVALLPIAAATFALFFVTGIALPVLPLHVHDGLGQSAFVVGLVAGVQFLVSLGSRIWAGGFSDRRGPKQAVIVGLVLAAVAGGLYLVSLSCLDQPLLSVAILLAGRGVLGASESFVITGAQSWALTLAGPQSAGRAIAWIGMAMYLALAIGAPVGSALFEGFGFVAIGIGTMLIPVLVLVAIVPLRPAAPEPQGERALFAVARAVWLPGLGLAFASLGFGAIASFAVLLFVERGWEPAWLSFTSFAVFFLAARLLLGHLADQIGGARVAILFAGVEALGLALIWLSPWPALGFLGAGLVGCGYSLVYPALGLESVRRAPPQSRGLAIGVYTAFLDVALGVLSPLLGILATGAGLGWVFLASAVIVALAIPVAWRLMAR